jgi:FMN-dependent NADH-azoreductase
MKLLHIDSSILGSDGTSRRLTAAIVARLRAANPSVDVTYRDLVADPLPHLTRTTLAKEHPLAGVSRSTADDALELQEFLAADVVVIGGPMYNFTISSQLKAWIDRVLVPRRTFGYGPEGAFGLMSGKRVIVAITRGGLYGAGTPMAIAEHAESYLRYVLQFIGIAKPEFIIAEGLMTGAEASEAALAAALQQANALHA